MPKSHVTFAKLVSSSSPTAWSQTYHAGSLAAAISLTHHDKKEKDSSEDAVSLHRIGKEIINTLETEYFSIEKKDLTRIKEAVATSCDKIPQTLLVNLVVTVVIDTILYLFIYGGGTVYLKRKEKFGILLEKRASTGDEHISNTVLSASGFLVDEDLVVLATQGFTEVISEKTLVQSIDDHTPSEIGEILSPTLHDAKVADAAAIIFSYHIQTLPSQEPEPLSSIPFPKTSRRFFLHVNVRQKIIIALALFICIVIAASIFLSVKKQQESKLHRLFQEVYAPAQKKYEEGQSLLSLNKKLAYEDFSAAKEMLEHAKGAFPQNTPEEKQIDALLEKVTSALTATPQEQTMQLKTVDPTASIMLKAEIDNTNVPYVTQDDKHIYGVDSEGIKIIDEKSKTKTIVKNENAWTTLGGFGTYLGNFYVLDKKTNQILKFIQGADGFGKTNYFPSGTSIDLSKANALTIDGAIWIVTDDGALLKYTKGNADSFTLSGLPKPFSHPTRVFTSVDATNVYILDNGNSRIVVLNKNGAYQTQYAADVIKIAKDFEVGEKDKKIYVLSDGKIYQVDLK